MTKKEIKDIALLFLVVEVLMVLLGALYKASFYEIQFYVLVLTAVYGSAYWLRIKKRGKK